MKAHVSTIICLALLTLFSCDSTQNYTVAQTTQNGMSDNASDKAFNEYWYGGNAELNSYSLEQARYGEIHKGEVVLVFVTEPFSKSKQVKLDYPQKSPKDDVSVLKLNNVRKFNTGIYDYSILTSTFTPINTKDHPRTLKTTTSVQEWCGVTFTQLNLDKDNYNMKQFSYFESEGDEEVKLDAVLLEDELFNRIRLRQGQLPEGEVAILPSVLQSRFSHKELKVVKARISKTMADGLIKYTIEYPSLKRTVTIDVEQSFPYKIMAWTEDNGRGLVTKAVMKKSINSPYWSQHNVADEGLRKDLMLSK